MKLLGLASIPAAEDSLGRRLAVLGICLAFGAWMIYIGRLNVRTHEAEETGKRALFLSLLGKSTSIQGRNAFVTGWIRIVLGVLMIAFGLVVSIFGAFLAK